MCLVVTKAYLCMVKVAVEEFVFISEIEVKQKSNHDQKTDFNSRTTDHA